MVALPPMDELIYKGTHNSYDPGHRIPPWEQVNDYGVWVVELDYMVPAPFLRNRHAAWNTDPPPLVIGHDGPGNAADGAGDVFGGPDFLLVDYLRALADTQALRFRPLLVYLDRKDFVGPEPGLFPRIVDFFDREFHENADLLRPLIEEALEIGFSGHVFGPGRLRDIGGQFPPIRELAGHIIAISNQLTLTRNDPLDGESLFHEGPPTDGRMSPFQVGRIGEGCDRPDFIAAGTQDSAINVYRLDNFSDDYTFTFAVPPNPIVVMPGARARDVIGCDDDTTLASPQGTRVLPFPTLDAAVERARGLAGGQETTRHRRAGLGFTVIATPGKYAEPLTIDFPLTIRGGPPSR